jgi:hypothetical protein
MWPYHVIYGERLLRGNHAKIRCHRGDVSFKDHGKKNLLLDLMQFRFIENGYCQKIELYDARWTANSKSRHLVLRMTVSALRQSAPASLQVYIAMRFLYKFDYAVMIQCGQSNPSA